MMGKALTGELSCTCDRSCSVLDKPRMLFVLLMNVEMPAIFNINEQEKFHAQLS